MNRGHFSFADLQRQCEDTHFPIEPSILLRNTAFAIQSERRCFLSPRRTVAKPVEKSIATITADRNEVSANSSARGT